MTQTTKIFADQATITRLDSKLTQVIASVLLGVLVILAVGFAPMDVAHNAAHDTRHTISVPCH